MRASIKDVNASMRRNKKGHHGNGHNGHSYHGNRVRRGQNAAEQLAIEFDKNQAMYEALHLDRAVTALGFEVHQRHLANSNRCQSHQVSASRDRHAPRATTAPVGKMDSDTTGNGSEIAIEEKSTKAEVVESPRITPDVLIKVLHDRGLGSPSWYRYPPPPPEAAISKHYSSFRKISFYMEKLKGRSRIDTEVANSKSIAFCEEMRETARAQNRSRSAQFLRSRFPDVYPGNQQADNLYGDGRSGDGSRTDLDTMADTAAVTDGSGKRGHVAFRRIRTWIADCELANDEPQGTEQAVK